MIMTDPVLRTMSDGDTSSELSQAALETVRKSASDSAGKLVMAEAKVVALTEQLAKAKKRIAELEGAQGVTQADAAGADDIVVETERGHSKPHASKR
jgi:hypothetical protein